MENTLTAKLDRQNRMLRMGLLLLALLLSGMLLTGQARSTARPTTVEAGRFVLFDDAGKERAVLGFDRDGAVNLSFLDTKGKIRTILGLLEDSLISGTPHLTFFEYTGVTRMNLGGAVHRKAETAVSRNSAGTFVLYDDHGAVIFYAPHP
jgi:hypothetical protein